MSKAVRPWLLIACGVLFHLNASACTKPVFRYALERWPASPCLLTVLHKGPVDAAGKARIDALCPEDAYNWNVQFIDVTGDLPEGPVRDKWQSDPDPGRLPMGLLQLPPSRGTASGVVWDGKLDSAGSDDLKRLLYAPVIRDTIRSLCKGDTAVWLLLKGPDSKANLRLRKRLETQLAALQKDLKLPHELDPLDSTYDDLAPGIPMKLAFSIREVDASASELGLLRNCLSAWDPELTEQSGPLIVPVFARGRALAVFMPDELDEEVIAEVCYFLVGPCSCRVKDLNPGFDLVMPFPWDRALWDDAFALDAVLKGLAPVAAKPVQGRGPE